MNDDSTEVVLADIDTVLAEVVTVGPDTARAIELSNAVARQIAARPVRQPASVDPDVLAELRKHTFMHCLLCDAPATLTITVEAPGGQHFAHYQSCDSHIEHVARRARNAREGTL